MSTPTTTRPTDASTRIEDLRCQVPEGVLAAAAGPLRLTWRISAGAGGKQLAYEIQGSATDDFVGPTATSGVVPGSEQVAIEAPGGSLRSREIRWLRVRVETDAGWTEWSPSLRVEAGLLEPADWVAEAVTLRDDPGADEQAPAPIVRREFTLAAEVAKARLYVTSLGLHRVTINGKPVTADLLSPGWTTYRHRLIAETYDVAAFLAPGANVLGAALGDGWYRGRVGWDRESDRGRYGHQVGLVAQLELELVDGTELRIATDHSWTASTAEIRSADLYDGAVIDLRDRREGWDRPGYDAGDWLPVAIVPLDRSVITPRIAPPVREIVAFPVTPVAAGPGCWELDGGQNIAGFVRLRIRGKRGDQVRVRHAEVLEPDGSLHTRSLRSARATDAYVLADTEETVLKPVFTFHGFRYAEVEAGDAAILAAEFVAISSDTPRRGRFESSNAALNRLHDNVVWSQRDNFVSVPTDCPQRDERLGWTGDAQAFAATACMLFDSQAFWASWLRDLELDQDDELGVPSVVPDVVLSGEPRYGRAGWADAAAIVPWAVFEAYGDASILRAQLSSMRRWVDSLRARRGHDGLLGTAMQFGDWLDPDAPSDRPWHAKTDPDYIANAFFAHSARLLADAAAMLGEADEAMVSRDLAETVARATWARWSDHAVTTQTGCAIALQLRIVPEAERRAVAASLARLVRDADGAVATGFLGTPLVLPALADAGHMDEAYLMLLRRDAPSWLYQVGQGATTVWERWDAIRPDGSIHPGTMSTPPGVPTSDPDGAHMLSFNHYAYGAVIDWVYRHVAGLAPDVADPGYRSVIFAPAPAGGIDWARASVAGPYGNVAIDWRLTEAGDLTVELEVPFGSTGTLVAPMTSDSEVTLDGSPCKGDPHLSPGRHTALVTRARIANPLRNRPA